MHCPHSDFKLSSTRFKIHRINVKKKRFYLHKQKWRRIMSSTISKIIGLSAEIVGNNFAMEHSLAFLRVDILEC